jgi:hypothetical protein
MFYLRKPNLQCNKLQWTFQLPNINIEPIKICKYKTKCHKNKNIIPLWVIYTSNVQWHATLRLNPHLPHGFEWDPQFHWKPWRSQPPRSWAPARNVPSMLLTKFGRVTMFSKSSTKCHKPYCKNKCLVKTSYQNLDRLRDQHLSSQILSFQLYSAHLNGEWEICSGWWKLN